MFGRVKVLWGISALLMFIALPSWAQNYVTGPDTGSESQIDNTPTNANFSLTLTGAGTYSLAGGIFYMKDGTSTVGSITLTLLDSTSTVLASVTQTTSQFCIGITNCQQYAYHTFTFGSVAGLAAGSYSIMLSTNAIPQQNSAYFVKGNGTSLAASTGISTTPDLTISKIASPSTFAQGATGSTYTIAVNNIGKTSNSGTITVTDTLDSNLTYVSSSGSGWTCGAASQVVTCTSTAAIAAGGASTPITIAVNVGSKSETSVTNNVSVAGGGETNTSNDTFQLVTSVMPGTPAPTPLPPSIWLTLSGLAAFGILGYRHLNLHRRKRA